MPQSLRLPVFILAMCAVAFAVIWSVGQWQDGRDPGAVDSRFAKEDAAQRALASKVVLQKWWITKTPPAFRAVVQSPLEGTLISYMQGVDAANDVVSHASLESVTCKADQPCASQGFLVESTPPVRRAVRVELDVGNKGLLRVIFTDDTQVTQDPSFVVFPLPPASPPP